MLKFLAVFLAVIWESVWMSFEMWCSEFLHWGCQQKCFTYMTWAACPASCWHSTEWHFPPLQQPTHQSVGSCPVCGQLLSCDADSYAIIHLSLPGHFILPFQGLCFPLVLIEFSGIDLLPFLQCSKIVLNSNPIFPSAYNISQPDVILTFCNCTASSKLLA